MSVIAIPLVGVLAGLFGWSVARPMGRNFYDLYLLSPAHRLPRGPVA